MRPAAAVYGAYYRAVDRVGAATVAVGVLVVAALAIRLIWLFALGAGEITWDGAEYVRAAENLRHGLGYIGLRGTTLFVFHPSTRSPWPR